MLVLLRPAPAGGLLPLALLAGARCWQRKKVTERVIAKWTHIA